jgi:ligand-binding sensor domain-containing protein/serine phosphatase RsbU (regulator of sigma subunit)
MGDKENNDSKPSPLFLEPHSSALNVAEGYITNQVSGDTIEPLLSGLGDTMQTGVPLTLTETLVDNDSIGPPDVKPILKTKTVATNTNVYAVRAPTVVAAGSYTPNLDSVDFVLVNSVGDTIPTGVEIPIQGKRIAVQQPEPVKSSNPAVKYNASYDIRFLDADHGTGSSTIWSLYEDDFGAIWMGTNGAGVTKYDGASFTQFDKKAGFFSDRIWDLLGASNGDLWFGSADNGVCRYDGESFTHIGENEGLVGFIVWDIFEDSSGNIWIGTHGGGVVKCSLSSDLGSAAATLTYYTTKEGLVGNEVSRTREDKDGNLWFGTLSGACKMDVKTGLFTQYRTTEGLSDQDVIDIHEDSNGILWMATDGGGIIKYDGDTFSNYSLAQGLQSRNFCSIHEDKSGDLWFMASNGGTTKFDGEKFTNFSVDNGLSSDIAWAMVESKGNIRWIATAAGGVNLLSETSFKNYSTREGLQANQIESMMEDSHGDMWFGAAAGYASKYEEAADLSIDSSTFTSYLEIGELTNNGVAQIIETKDGSIWWGILGSGINKLSATEVVQFNARSGLIDDMIISMMEDNEGNIWVGAFADGVVKYNPNQGVFSHYKTEGEMLTEKVYGMIQDSVGNIWFGTDGNGVVKYEPAKAGGGNFTQFTEKEGLSSNDIGGLFEDSKGNIWIGTFDAGVNKFDGTHFTYYTEKEGLGSNSVRSIIEDSAGNIWLGLSGGLALLARDSVGTFAVKNYNKQDGLKGTKFENGSVCLDSRNQLWWGTESALLMLDLSTFGFSFEPPSLQLNRVEINEQFIDLNLYKDSTLPFQYASVKPFTNYPLGLELPYDQNHLTFYFSAIDWQAPHKIKYSYKILGLNDDWSEPTAEGKADYRNVPYGDHTLQVCVIGESGKWSDALEYNFVISAPWWHTWWARSMYGLTSLLLVLTIIRWRTAQLKQRQKELEIEVENATKEITRKKEQIEEAHKEITDSINYAERIQRSFLATESMLDENLTDYFVFFKPKDVVSGDFYWAGTLENGDFALLTADSTGHGVPGAIMSILNISSIEKAVESGLTKPAEIFNHTRKTIIERLKKDGSVEGGKDGMDASLVSFDFAKNTFTYATAHSPIWIVREQNLLVLKPDKMPVGKHDNDTVSFSQSEFEWQKGDVIYTQTDGFVDQFGGTKGKKFMTKNLKTLLISIAHLPMAVQQKRLTEVFEEWIDDLEQVDDICIVGVRV